MTQLATIPEAEWESVASEVQVPPHDLDAEAAVISAALIGGESSAALATARDIVQPAHFYSEAHRRIWEAVIAVADAGHPVDVMTVGSRLKETARIAQVGGMAYLTEIINAAPAIGADRVRAYAVAVYDRWRLREAIRSAQQLVAEGYGGIVDSAQRFLDDYTRALTKIANAEQGKAQESNLDALRRIFVELKAGAEARMRGMPVEGMGAPTGFDWLDAKVYGLRPSKKLTVLAWPGVGKSVLCMQLAASACTAGVGVVYFTAEPSMTRDDFLLRLVASVSGVDFGKLRRLDLSVPEFGRVQDAFGHLSKLPLQIVDARGWDVDRISADARRYLDTFRSIYGAPLGVVVVDYEQVLDPPPHLAQAKKNVVVEYTSTKLAKLAATLKVSVLTAAQRKRTDMRKPAPQDAEWSAAIEQSSDQMLYLHRDGEKQSDGTWRVLALLAKNRGGEDDITTPLVFHGAEMRFETDYARIAQTNGEERYWNE